MSEVLERAARAAAEHYGFVWDELPDVNPIANGELDKRHFLESAEAMFKAIREPGAVIIAAMRAELPLVDDPQHVSDEEFEGYWQSMIDAALGECDE